MQNPLDLPRVSVIVPVYNGERTLPVLIKSLHELDYPASQLEVWLVDNNSTDRSAELIRASGFGYLQENRIQSSYAARNQGISQARGEVLAFTDADCRVDPGWLREGIQTMRAQGADLVAGEIKIEVSDPANLYQLYSASIDLPQRAFVSQGYAVTANLLVKKIVMDHLGGFQSWMISGGDRLFTEEAQAQGYRLVFSERALVFHEARSSGRSLRRKSWRVAFGFAQLRAHGRPLPLPFREWRYYFPGWRLYREFVAGRPLNWLDRTRAFVLIWGCKLAMAAGSWAGSRYCRSHPPPQGSAGEYPK